MVTTRPPKTIVKPTALGPVANTDTKLLICGLFQKGRVLAQDGGDISDRLQESLRVYQCTHSRVANSTSSGPRQGPRRRVTSVL